MISRSPSPAVNSPNSTARTENTASHRDILSLCASNDDKFNNSPSKDDQDLAPDPEMTNVSDTHSEAASEDTLTVRQLRRTYNFGCLSKKFLSSCRPICFLGKQMSFLEGTGQDLQLIWNYRRLPKRASPCPNQGDP